MGKERAGGKVVVVTGGASGIGRALARRFGGAGWRVAILDYDDEALANAAATLAEEQIDSLAVRCDITSDDQCRSAIDKVIRGYGGVDVLINNAGITHVSPFDNTEIETFRRVLDVNVLGAVRCSKAALAALQARRGAIVVISSVAGFAPLTDRSGYAASKHALHGLFETVRVELADSGVHVMIVCPGFTNTAIERHALGGGADEKAGVRTVVGKVAEASEVADAIYRGLARRRKLIVLSPVGQVARLLTRIAPSLYERLMARSLARA